MALIDHICVLFHCLVGNGFCDLPSSMVWKWNSSFLQTDTCLLWDCNLPVGHCHSSDWNDRKSLLCLVSIVYFPFSLCFTLIEFKECKLFSLRIAEMVRVMKSQLVVIVIL